jgi:hypothetical protein
VKLKRAVHTGTSMLWMRLTKEVGDDSLTHTSYERG